MELGLVLEAHRRRRWVWQRCAVEERREQAGLGGGTGFVLDLRALRGRGHVRIRRAASEVAVDLVVLDAIGDPLEPGLVRLAVLARLVRAERRPEPVVDESVLGGQLGGRVPADPAGDLVGFEQDDLPLLAQQQRRRDADDTPDGGDVALASPPKVG